MNGPAVTVVTPTFNHASYIGACIESVLAQTTADWEMIVVDDGSTDETLEIVRSYGDARIRVLTGPRRGLSRLGEAYNAGLAASRAPLVAVLEGDDTWPVGKLERQLPQFADQSVVLAYGAAELIDEYGCSYARYARAPRRGTEKENWPVGSIVRPLAAHNFIVAATVVLRRSTIERIGGFWQPDGIPYVDHPTWLRLALEGRFTWSSQTVGCWRRHPQQWTTQTSTAVDPDRTAYVAEVAAHGRRRGLAVPPGVTSEISTDPARLRRWADLNAFRRGLLEGGLRDAARASRPLLATRRPAWWMLAALGLGSRLAGGDLEWVFRMTNRFSWPSRRHVRSHHRG